MALLKLASQIGGIELMSFLQSQKKAVCGVNLDEAIALLTYERALQGAARSAAVVGRLLDDWGALVR